MLEQSYTLPATDDYHLHITAKRYWLPELEANTANPAARTLIVLHSTSFHKETWEPALLDLLNRAVQPESRVTIRDAWAIDCPNHGESAQLNVRALKEPEFANFSCEKYAQAVHRFLSAGPEHGARVDFRRRNLVGVGHSLGANSILNLQSIEPQLSFSSLVIIEPMVSAEGTHLLAKLRAALVQGANRRQDVWPSREAAFELMSKRSRTAKWDRRVIQAFVNHALRWQPESNSFRLLCTRQQEVVGIAMYLDEEGPTKPVEDLNKICHHIPVHLILGQICDFIPARVQNALTDPKSGRRYASIVKIPNVGHLIPQEAPAELASFIYDALALPVPTISRL
ncbi:Alpha/beta hydrolase fold-1 [Crassisporium funariophilum]|nr:Alpha/beta hydrolase fold-1 [Crassisporium funariophilum]